MNLRKDQLYDNSQPKPQIDCELKFRLLLGGDSAASFVLVGVSSLLTFFTTSFFFERD